MFTPLKVKITRKNGQNQYPDFNSLPAEVRHGGEEWTECINSWHYDEVSGFRMSDAENPDPRVLYGVCLVCDDFADAAVGAFPDLCAILTEDEFETFHDNRAHVYKPDDKLDCDALGAIRTKYGVPANSRLKAADDWDQPDKDALDRMNPTPGIVASGAKWADRKALRGLEITKRS